MAALWQNPRTVALVCGTLAERSGCAWTQNALKYTRAGGKVQVRGKFGGGLFYNTAEDFFKPSRADGNSVGEPSDD